MKRFFISFAGLFGTNVILFLLFPTIANLYGTEAIGEYGRLIAISNVAVTLATFRLEQSLVYENDESLIFSTYLFLCVWSAVILLFSLLLGLNWTLSALVTILQAFYLFLTSSAISKDRFRFVAAIRFLRGVGLALLQIFIFFVFDPGNLLYTHLIYVAILVFFLVLAFRRIDSNFISIDLSVFISLIKARRQFFYYSAPQAFFFILVVYLPIIYFNTLFSIELIAILVLADRMVGTPMNAVTQALRDVFLRIELNHSNLRFTLIIILASTLFLLSTQEQQLWIIKNALSLMKDEWHEAGEAVLILFGYYFSLCVLAPFTAHLVKSDRQHITFWYSIVLSATSVGLTIFITKSLPEYFSALSLYYYSASFLNIIFASSLGIFLLREKRR